MPQARASGAIDSLINSAFLNLAGEAGSGGLGHLFPDIGERPTFDDPEQLLKLLDASDIGAAVISIMEPDHAEWVGDAHRRFPKKILPAMILNPLDGMDEVRRVVEYHERYGVRCLRIPPFRYILPPTDRVYWPFYVKAIELGIPVSMNCGYPGPRRPAWVQDPRYFDEVAYHFPELRLIMTHCGQPWTEEAIATIAHWDNVFMSCTSVAPQYWPDAFVRFINTRGREKMMFGTEFPTIPWERSREELDGPAFGGGQGLRDSVAPLFFAENARRIYGWDAEVD